MLHELNPTESIDIPVPIISDESSDEHHFDEHEKERTPRSALAKELTAKLVDRTIANITLLPQNGNNSIMDFPDMEQIPLARAQWILLGKNNGQQMQLCKQTILNIIQKYPQTRPMWRFSRDLDYGKVEWQDVVQQDNRFRHHCASIQAGITMIMDNLNNMHGMAKLLREIGFHHFFYDAYEPHFELMHECFLEALNTLQGPLDADLIAGWNQFWTQVKASICYGVGIQRQTYLKECVTYLEINSIRLMWEKVKERGLEEVGEKIVRYAIKNYEKLIKTHKVNYPVDLPQDTLAFKLYSQQVVKALDLTIEIYTPEKGFLSLPKKLKGFVTQCLMINVCPTLIRKSFMESLIKVLTEIHGESNMTEVTIHTWSKIYRILEQAIIWNIVHY
ncbi:hypothetical protein FO519_007941 [Halicephalobus sp. NKZ332]|nr:hypothetical protein FO519_007941 [Halicephalobus sp. NKZ332]